MSDNDIADRLPLVVSQGDGYAAGINRDAVVYQEAGQPLVWRGAALAIKGAG
jgi:hypothetical protein